MLSTSRSFATWLPWIVLIILGGCAVQPGNRPQDIRLVTVANQEENTPAPSFLISEWQQPYNRIGTVRTEQHNEYERIYIDSTSATFYYGSFPFTTGRERFVNQVYRVHFAKIPFSLIPFHFGAGSNVGVLVIVTIDTHNRPVLVTTANTCGCYVAIIPTSYLSPRAYPVNFPEKEQRIYGETLPARLEISSPDDGILVTIRPEVHRVMNVQVMAANSRPALQTVAAQLLPLSSLKSLPLPEGGTTSMFYDRWPLQGHVKGAIKPWESLLLSLVSLDFYVGMDKEYGSTAISGNTFYTSLKPWNRRLSDMNDFAGFLRFHDWKL